MIEKAEQKISKFTAANGDKAVIWNVILIDPMFKKNFKNLILTDLL